VGEIVVHHNHARRQLALLTYRPEYHGVLARAPNAQTIALAPLDISAISLL